MDAAGAEDNHRAVGPILNLRAVVALRALDSRAQPTRHARCAPAHRAHRPCHHPELSFLGFGWLPSACSENAATIIASMDEAFAHAPHAGAAPGDRMHAAGTQCADPDRHGGWFPRFQTS